MYVSPEIFSEPIFQFGWRMPYFANGVWIGIFGFLGCASLVEKCATFSDFVPKFSSLCQKFHFLSFLCHEIRKVCQNRGFCNTFYQNSITL